MRLGNKSFLVLFFKKELLSFRFLPCRESLSRRVGIRQKGSLIVRLIYAACLLGATFNHARTVAAHGILWNYGGVPVASAAFWTSLTLLDPLAALLLITRPNADVLATAAIILSDAIHNLWMTARHAQPHHLLIAVTSDFFVTSQILFLLFVAATMPIAWTRRARPLTPTHA